MPIFSASKFGVKKLLPAYLDPNLQLQDLLTGVSFGSGGAGYDPLTSEIAVNNFYVYISNITLHYITYMLLATTPDSFISKSQ